MANTSLFRSIGQDPYGLSAWIGAKASCLPQGQRAIPTFLARLSGVMSSGEAGDHKHLTTLSLSRQYTTLRLINDDSRRSSAYLSVYLASMGEFSYTSGPLSRIVFQSETYLPKIKAVIYGEDKMCSFLGFSPLANWRSHVFRLITTPIRNTK